MVADCVSDQGFLASMSVVVVECEEIDVYKSQRRWSTPVFHVDVFSKLAGGWYDAYVVVQVG